MAIRVRTREIRLDADDGRLFAANGCRVLRILDPAGAEVPSGIWPTMHYVQDGEFVGHWNTSSLSTEGDYEVELEVATGWDTVANTRVTTRRDIVVRLVRQGAV